VIPPSIGFILFGAIGAIGGVSISKVFMAGIVLAPLEFLTG